MTIPQTAPSAPMPVYAITTPIPAAVEQHQTFGVSSSIGWYEVDASGEITTIPLGQSGPFTLLVNAEQILCSSLEAGIVTVWQSPTETGRGFGATSVAAHIASSPVSVHGTSSADAGGSAPLDSPHFTGVPTAPTNSNPADNTTQLATDAFVQLALGGGGTPFIDQGFVAVYAYNTTTDTSHIILGGIEAATSTNAILLPNSYFMGPADANGITEIAFNI